jgi:hypothetical protein
VQERKFYFTNTKIKTQLDDGVSHSQKQYTIPKAWKEKLRAV